MDNRCIGVFDSGIGGLTAVAQLFRLLPKEKIVYFGDTGRVPYGTRTTKTIIKYVREDIGFLMTKKPKIILAACGTASAVALDALKHEFDVDILGVVEFAAQAALATTKNGRIGVIGTTATIKSGKYQEFLNKDGIQVSAIACPLFVPLAENGHTNSEVTRLIAEEYLDSLKSADVDTLILGCTHYPLLSDAITSVMGGGVRLVNASETLALAVCEYLDDGKRAQTSDLAHEYYVSDAPAGFSNMAKIFLGQPVDAQRIDFD